MVTSIIVDLTKMSFQVSTNIGRPTINAETGNSVRTNILFTRKFAFDCCDYQKTYTFEFLTKKLKDIFFSNKLTQVNVFHQKKKNNNYKRMIRVFKIKIFA